MFLVAMKFNLTDLQAAQQKGPPDESGGPEGQTDLAGLRAGRAGGLLLGEVEARLASGIPP